MKDKNEDCVEIVRWARLEPRFNRQGEVVAAEISAVVKTPPREMKGPTIKLTLRVPKRLFSPVASVLIELDEDNVFGTVEAVAADLAEMRKQLGG